MNKLIAGASVALLLVACGGGGSAPAPVAADPTVEVPSSASQSSTGMVSYLNALSGASAENKEPLNIDGFDPTATQRDDTEPDVVS